MLEVKAKEPRYPTVEFIVGAIAEWIKSHRSSYGVDDELARCSPEEIMKIARDLGLPISDFRSLTAKGPDAAKAMFEMLCALSMAPETLAARDPATMRDLQRTCILCEQKRRCSHELAEGTAAEHFHEFCPNAYTLAALLKQKEQLREH